jgi:thiamine kinase-like enzyme
MSSLSKSRGSSPVPESIHSSSLHSPQSPLPLPESTSAIQHLAWQVLGSHDSIHLKDIQVVRLLGGASNQIYMASVGHKAVVIRQYGVGAEAMIGDQRPFEISVTRAFGELGVGPKVIKIWEGARAEEFIEGRALRREDFKCERVRGKVAGKLALLHSSDLEEEGKWSGEEMDLWVFRVVNKWAEMAKKVQGGKFTEVVDKLVRDFYEVYERLWKRFKSDVVLCHNDLNAGNILVNGNLEELENENVYLLDYEYAGYNFRIYDLGNVWCETFMDNHHHEFPYFKTCLDDGLSVEELGCFCKEYIQARNLLKNEDQFELENGFEDEDQEADFMTKQVIAYSLGSHVVWGLWGLSMSEVKDIQFGYEEYGKTRIGLFYKFQTIYKQYLQ